MKTTPLMLCGLYFIGLGFIAIAQTSQEPPQLKTDTGARVPDMHVYGVTLKSYHEDIQRVFRQRFAPFIPGTLKEAESDWAAGNPVRNLAPVRHCLAMHPQSDIVFALIIDADAQERARVIRELQSRQGGLPARQRARLALAMYFDWHYRVSDSLREVEPIAQMLREAADELREPLWDALTAFVEFSDPSPFGSLYRQSYYLRAIRTLIGSDLSAQMDRAVKGGGFAHPEPLVTKLSERRLRQIRGMLRTLVRVIEAKREGRTFQQDPKTGKLVPLPPPELSPEEQRLLKYLKVLQEAVDQQLQRSGG